MATKAEQAWMDRIADFGCIVCYLHKDGIRTPPQIHHMLTDGGRRIGHLATLPLCPIHHKHDGMYGAHEEIARHPYKARFEAKYGTEEYLLDSIKRLVNV